MNNYNHIHPIFNQTLQRSDKESMLWQRGIVIWFTGLSGSGKSTIAVALEKRLFELGYLTQILDGDNVRMGINSNLGFSEDDRQENIRRIAEVAKLFTNCGVITLCSLVSPTIAARQLASDIIGKDDFVEIYVSAPLEVCEQRDVKGLYNKARAGLIKDFTGIDAPYEAPIDPALTILSDKCSVDNAVEEILAHIYTRIEGHK
jgi:adenylylsulfate kinase